MKRFLTCALSGVFFIWLPNAFADDNGGSLADAPSHIRQAQGNHKALLTLRADNIQVRAEWRVTSAVKVFDIHEGELKTVTTIVAPVTHVATIYAVDRFDLLNSSYANLTASAVITVEFLPRDTGEFGLSDVPRLTAVAGEAANLHTLVATGGSGDKTYTLVAGGDGHFVLDEASGVLSLRAEAEPDIYTLTVEARDDANDTDEAVATVEVSAALMLSDAPLISVALGAAVSLHKFIASGGIGAKTYTLIGGDENYFSVDAGSGVLSLLADAQAGVHTLTVQAIDEGRRTVEGLATVRVSAALALSDVPSFTVIASVGMNLHTFVASGGIGTPTYEIVSGNKEGHFDLDAASGVLSLTAGAEPDTYVLRIQVTDARDNTAEAVATVGVSALLSLAAVSLLEAIEGKAVSLHMFSASGGIGMKTYTLAAGDEDYFSVDVGSGVLSLSMNAKAEKYTLTVQVMDARNNTAQAVATVGVSAALELAAASPFTVIASVAMSLHTFVAGGGIGIKTYTLAAGDKDYFSVDASSGVLSLLADAEVGRHTLTVQVTDGRDNTAQAVAMVEVSAVLALTEAPSFTVIASVAMSLHAFIASGGIGSRTYTLLAGDENYFSVGAGSGVLSLSMNAEAGRHLLTVQVMDARDNTAQAVATVGVSALLALAEAPSFTVIASVAMSLHAFIASGGIGSKTYTLLAGDERYFSVGAGSGVLSLLVNAEAGRHTLTVQVMDARDNTAQAVATVEVSAVLALAEAPSFTVIISAAMSLHTFIASDGIGTPTYAVVSGNGAGHFTLNATSGVLSLLADAEPDTYVLRIQAMDGRDNTAETVVTVGVSAVLALANAPRLGGPQGTAISLYMFEAQGGIGARTYTLLTDDVEDYFSLGAESGVLSLLAAAPLAAYTLSVQVRDERGNVADALATVGVDLLFLSDAPRLSAIVGREVSLHTFDAKGVIGTLTYTIAEGNEDSYFNLDTGSGVLSVKANAPIRIYTLSVLAEDNRSEAKALAVVEVRASLSLAAVPPLTVIAGRVAHTLVASGGIGTPTYAILAGNKGGHFALGAASGVLSLRADAALGRHTLTLQVADVRANTAQAVVTVGVSAVLSLSEVSLLEVIAENALSLHTFVAGGGIGSRTYTLLASNDRYFSVGAESGVLSLSAGAAVGRHTLTVQVMDGRDNTAQAVATVGVSAVLALAEAPSFTVIASVAMDLHTFIASGGIGVKAYTLRAGDDGKYFSVDAASGVLSLSMNAPAKDYMLTVQVMDERGSTAQAVAMVGVSAALSLAEVSPLIIIVGDVAHTLVASGGIGVKTYTITGGDEEGYFTLDVISGVLSLSASAPAKMYTLTVRATDERNNIAELVAMVEVSAVLALAAAPSFTVIASVAMSLHAFIASGGIGVKTYTLLAGDAGEYFSVDAASGVLSLSINAPVKEYMLTVQVMDGRDNTAQAVAMVEVSAALALTDAPPFTVIASVAMSLHAFIASGGIGSSTYTLLAGDDGYFSVGAGNGVLSLSADAEVGRHTLTVQVMDGRNNTAQAVATVVVSAALALADAPPFTVIASVAMSLHAFIASGGIGVKTYTLVAGDAGEYFSVDAASGVLSLSVNAPAREYMLTVQVKDERDNTAEGVAVVAVSAALTLAEAPPFTVIASVAMSLHRFIASGGIGVKTYTLVADGDGEYFSVDAASGVLSLSVNAPTREYTLTVQVKDERDNTAEGVAVVEVSAMLSLAEAPPFTVIAGVALSLHTFAASGGVGLKTYTLVSVDELGYFSVDAASGVLSLSASAITGKYTLTVQAIDERDNTAEALATVVVSAALSLAEVPLLAAIVGLSVTVNLHTLTASGGIGAKTYILGEGNEAGYFVLNATSGVLSLQEGATAGVYPLSVEVSDNAGNRASVPVTVDVLPLLFVMDTLSFSARVGQAVSLYTFSTTDRVAQTYILAAGNEGGYFSLDAGWVLSVSNQAPVGMYQLRLEGSDSRGNQATAVVKVRIIRDGIFVLGGQSGAALLNDVWSSAGGEVWMSVGVGGWSERLGHQAVLHQGRLHVLGGANFSERFNDVWSLVINNWERADDAGWSARWRHQAVSHKGRLYVLGGDVLEAGNVVRKNDVWSWAEGENWSEETAAAEWAARRDHQAVSHRGRLYVLGGDNRNDVWSSVDGKVWSLEMTVAGEWNNHQAVSHNGRLYVLGGSNGNDMWSSADGKSWRQEMVTGWQGRSDIQAVSYRGRLYVLGGDDGISRNDVWSWAEGGSWTRETGDAGWLPRSRSQAVVFPQPLIFLGMRYRFRLTVGLSSANVYTFQAQYGVGNYTYSLSSAEVGFSIDNHGVLSADGNIPMGSYTFTVRVEDEIGTATQTEVHVDVALPALPLLTDIAGKIIYTFTVGGGIGEKTYTIEDGNDAQHFTLGGASGNLSVRAEGETGKYTLQVKISDSRGDYAVAPVTVEVVPPLSLAGASLTSWAQFPVVVTLHDFAVNSGIGAKVYTLVAGDEAGYFALDEISGVLSLPVNQTRLAGNYTLSVVVSDSAVPPYRATATVAVRLKENAIFVLGGVTGLNALRNDVWSSFDGRSWREEKVNNSIGWPARDRYQAVLHRGRLYVLGGHNGSSRFNDVWSSLDGRSWRQEKANSIGNSEGWSPRENHQAVSHNGLLYVLGGFDGTKKNDVWSSADGKSWTMETGNAGAGWSKRMRHRAVSHNGRLYVLGGFAGSLKFTNDGARSDVWSSADGKIWRQETGNAWPKRNDHQVVSHKGRLYVLGGATGLGVRKNDVWSWSPEDSTTAWQPEKVNGAGGWGKRRNHQAVSYAGRLYVLGGFDGGRRNDVWSSADGKIWSQEADASWSGRQDHQAVVFPPSLDLPGVAQRRVVAGLQKPNIHTFEAKYGRLPYAYSLSPVIDGFSIDESHGVLSENGSTQPGNYSLTVRVEDKDGARAQTEVDIDVVIFGGVSLLFALAGRAEVIYTFDAMDEMQNHTYALAAGNEDGYFSLETNVALSVTEEAAAGLYTLLVEVSDSAGNQISAPVTVDVLPPLFVTDTLSFSARVGRAVSLYTFSTTDRVGAQTYILAAGNEEGYFSLDAGWVLSVSKQATLGMYQLRLEGSDREGNQATAVVKVRIIRDGIFVLGGFGFSTRLNDIWSSVDGNSWMPEGSESLCLTTHLQLVGCKSPTLDGGWSARNGHQAVVHQGHLHVLGGLTGNGTRNDVWSMVATSWVQADNADWSARYYHQAVSHNERLYVLGGATSPDDGEYLRDVWSSADGTSWSRVTAAADWSARQEHQAVSHQGRLYVLGGLDGDGPIHDVWSSVDGKSWMLVTMSAAWSKRARHQAVSHQGRLYVLGGFDSSFRNDVWSSVDGKSWRQETAAAGWPGRFYHQAVSYNGRLYVLGGSGFPNLLNDVWSSVDGKSWSQEADASWPVRQEHQAVVFPQPLVLLGMNTRFRLTVGLSSSNIDTFQARYGVGNYIYSLSSAEAGFSIDNHGVLSADGNTPMGSYTLTVQVEDETGSLAQIVLPVDVALPALPLLTAFVGKVIYTFTVGGGIGEKTYAIEEGDGAQYFTLGGASGKLSVRAEAEAGKYTLRVKISDSRGDYAAGAITVQALLPLSLVGMSLTGWARLSVAVTLHDFAVSGVGAKHYTLVVGNEAGYFALDEISGVLSLPVNPARLAGDYTLSLAVSDSDEPPNRATVVVKVRLEKNGIFVLGGDDGGRRNDVWSSGDGKNWMEEMAAAWSARENYQAVSHRGRLYVLGGYDGSSRNDVWSSADGKSWMEETAAAAWSARSYHQVVSHRGRLYVLGGYDGSRRNDVWSSADGKSWMEETAAAAWSIRSAHQVVSHRGRLYVLGGFGSGRLNDVWSSADGKSWREETAAAAWPARSGHQAVSHRGRLYVLGGSYRNDVWSSADGKSWRKETEAAAWTARSKLSGGVARWSAVCAGRG